MNRTLILSLFLLFSVCIYHAQLLVNRGFEDPFLIENSTFCSAPQWVGNYMIDANDFHTGSNSLKLSVLVDNKINTAIGWGNDTIPMTAYQSIFGNFGKNGNIWQSMYVQFYAKYKIAPSDSALANVLFYNGGSSGSVQAGGSVYLTGTQNQWELVTIPIQAIGKYTVDEISINFSSTMKIYYGCKGCNSIDRGNGVAENELWIDDVFISPYSGLGLTEQNLNLKAYPNPTQDFVQFDLPEEIKLVKVFDIYGKQVFEGCTHEANVSFLSNGIYQYTVCTIAGNAYKGNFVKY